MGKLSIWFIPLIAIILFSVLIAFAPMFTPLANSMKDLSPYSDYSYTGYANTTSGIVNLTQTASRVKTIAEADNSDIAKSEYIVVSFVNANTAANNITANATFNDAIVSAGMSTLYGGATTTFTFTNISCANGLNTITAGSTVATSNLTLTNATMVCATALNGTDYSWIISVGFLTLGLMIIGIIIILSGILKFKIFK